MTGVNVNMAGVRELKYKFEKARKELEDMRPLMRRIKEQLYVDEFEIFNQGQTYWHDWSKWYAKWRGFRFPGGPAGEMLGLTGRLQESLFHEGGENIAIVNRRSVSFGTMVPYAEYHHTGGIQGGWARGAPLPKRDPFEFTENMKRQWRRIVENYVGEAMP